MSAILKTLMVLGIIALIGGTLAGYWFVLRDPGFQLSGTSPRQDTRTDIPSPTITFTFNQPIRIPANFSITSDPILDAEVFTRGDTLLITPTHALLEQQEYTVTTSRIESETGESVESAELTFRTGRADSPRLEFIRSLPVHNPGYSVTYLEDEDTFVVRITEVPIKEKQLRAQNYLQSNGIEPSQNDIEFDVLRSLENRGAPPG